MHITAWEVEVQLYAFLTFAVSFTRPGQEASSTHLDGLQSQAGRSGHKKILTLLGIEIDQSVVQSAV